MNKIEITSFEKDIWKIDNGEYIINVDITKLDQDLRKAMITDLLDSL